MAIYDYNETIKKLIYQFKGCYDYELKDVFLFRYVTYLKWKFNDYILVPAPSSKVDDEKRGFNHAELIGRGFARRAGLRFDPAALIRLRETVPMKASVFFVPANDIGARRKDYREPASMTGL